MPTFANTAHRYVWVAGDHIADVCSHFLPESGWPSTDAFFTAVTLDPRNTGDTIRPGITDWLNIAPGTILYLPYAQ